MLVEFFLICMFYHVWEKFFNFMVFTFLEDALDLWIFTSVPQSKLQVECFENLFLPRQKGWRKLWFALLKFNQKISRWPGTLIYLNYFTIFCMICSFFKCVGFTVLWIISIKECGIYYIYCLSFATMVIWH